METPTPFDLNEAIRRWQQDLGASPAFKADNVEELASHLRASIQRLRADGHSEEEAFQIAARRIGERGPLEREFGKVNRSATWSLAAVLFWIAASLYLFQVFLSLIAGVLQWQLMLDMRKVSRLLTLFGTRPLETYPAFNNHFYHYHLPSFAPELSIWLVLVLILGARLATGSWKKFGAIIKIFEHPILAVLGLVVLGHAAITFPPFFPAFDGAWGWNYLAGMPVINDVLVLLMVLLARRGLRKTSRACQS